MKKFTLEAFQKEFRLDLDDNIKIFAAAAEHISVCSFKDKEVIVDSRKPLEHLYLVQSGKAKVSLLHENGKISIVHFIQTNDLIGELTLLGIETQHKDVYSIGTSILLTVPMAVAREALLKDNDFLLAMSRYIGNKLLNRTWLTTKLQRYELKHQLAAYILLCETDGQYREKHVQTADYLGVSYRHLLYTLRQFQDEGLLDKVANGYLVNREGLERLANVLE